MRIMQVISGAGVNGAAMHCRLLCKELATRGHDVTLVCRAGAWIAEQVAGEPISVVECDQKRWPTHDLRKVASEARRREIDVVHTHQSRAHFFGVLLRRFYHSVPTVATAHSRRFQPHWMWNDFVIAPSDATARYERLVNWVSSRRIKVIHNFIDADRFAHRSPETRQKLRGQCEAGDATVVLGVVGDVIPRKSQGTLVEALPTILSHQPDLRVVMIGPDGHDYAAQVKDRASALGVDGRITWLGARRDVADWLQAIDLFVLPSRDEQMPIAVMEAMSAGLPIVGTLVGGMPALVEDGVSGRLVRAGDSAALADALKPLVTDRSMRDRWGAASRERAIAHFSPASQVAQVEDVYRQLADRRLARRAA